MPSSLKTIQRNKKRASNQRGAWAEVMCVLYLQLKGYRILRRRFVSRRGSGAGEVDIIAATRTALVFVEVKAHATFDKSVDNISPRQQARILKAAQWFAATHPHIERDTWRFDALVVTYPLAWCPVFAKIKHIQNAFGDDT